MIENFNEPTTYKIIIPSLKIDIKYFESINFTVLKDCFFN